VGGRLASSVVAPSGAWVGMRAAIWTSPRRAAGWASPASGSGQETPVGPEPGQRAARPRTRVLRTHRTLEEVKPDRDQNAGLRSRGGKRRLGVLVAQGLELVVVDQAVVAQPFDGAGGGPGVPGVPGVPEGIPGRQQVGILLVEFVL